MPHVKIRDRKVKSRMARKRSIRKRLRGTAARPRLSVFRSLKHIYVQAIDDDANQVLATASDMESALKDSLAGKKKAEKAREIGKAVGARLKEKGVSSVVFDRNGYIYHGRVKEVADGARESGLEF